MRSNGSPSRICLGTILGFDPSVRWESILDRQLRSRMTTRPFQFAGIEDINRPNCELLERCQRPEAQRFAEPRIGPPLLPTEKCSAGACPLPGWRGQPARTTIPHPRHQKTRQAPDSGVPAPCGSPPRRIAPLRLYYRRGSLIDESRERVASAIRLGRMTGDVGVSPTIKFPLLLARRRGPGRRLD